MSQSVSSIQRSEDALQLLKAKPGTYRLFCKMIEKRFTPSDDERSEHVEQMVPFLFTACSSPVARSLAIAFFDVNCTFFSGLREDHIQQVQSLLDLHESRWMESELTQAERSLIEGFPLRYQEAIRICRSLSLDISNKDFPPPTFYLSSQEFADRMETYKEDGRRILTTLEREGILSVVRRGTKREKGQRGVATVYAYEAPTAPTEPPVDATDDDIPF